MGKKIEYVGSCYIGVVGPEDENGECRDSIENIVRRHTDEGPRFIRATKGYEARQMHFDYWLSNTLHPFMLLLDHDMKFQPDTLERLRGHRLPYVSGFYMRRRYAPIAPVWFQVPPRNGWPMIPFMADPERGKLHPLGASGWGCILMHRDVALATMKVLKGELCVAEDDMDVWPYDLDRIMHAVNGLRTLTTEQPSLPTLLPALEAHVKVLEEEIRPLRGVKDPIGSDIRFPFYARAAGYTLYGDPDVRPGHMLSYPLAPDDFSGVPEEVRQKTAAHVRRGTGVERKRISARVKALRGEA